MSTLTMLKPICEHSQGKRLSFSYGFIRCLPVGEHARQFHHFGEPTAIIFLFILNGENHYRHLATILSQHVRVKQRNKDAAECPDRG